MKKTMFPLLGLMLLLSIWSCRDTPYSYQPVPNCSWDKTEDAVFYNLQLKYPDGLSTYHNNLLPFDKIHRSFIDIIVSNSEIGANG